MKYKYLRDLLFLLPPELSHFIALHTTSLMHRLHLTHLVAGEVPEDPIEVMGIQFKNRVGLAAGLDKDGICVDGLGALGFGFLEVGTVTPRGQKGNARPRLFRLTASEALINRMGFNNEGVDVLVERLKHTRFDGVLGINIGKNFDTPLEDALNDYEYCLRRVYEYAAYIVVNISSPNTPGLRDLQRQDEMAVLLETLKKVHGEMVERYSVRVPLLVKIAPDMVDDDVRQLARRLLAFEIDGVIVGNTTVSRAGVTDEPLASETGGLSGAPLLSQSNHVLQIVAEEVKGRMGIIGVGGIMSGEDAAAKIALGADLVQIYTGFIYQGPGLIRECVEAMRSH
ncbi:MAG: quinone-dependent dihydroorotate dehydrogenase [Pseudomonadales bacterium]